MNENPGPAPAVGGPAPEPGAADMPAPAPAPPVPPTPTQAVGAGDVLAGGPSRPPRRLGRRIALVLGGVTAVLAVLALVAVFVVVPRWRASSPDWLARRAIERVDKATVLHYRGTFVDELGRSVQLDVRSGPENRSVGTVELEGHRAEFIADRTGTYVKADAGYWNVEVPSAAGVLAGQWVNTNVSALRMRLSLSLPPDRLVVSLQSELIWGKAKPKKSTERTIEGDRAVRITASTRGAVYVTTKAPHRVARIEGALLGGPAASGLNDYAFDVSELSAAESTAFETRFATLSKITAVAVKPDNPTTMPARYVVDEILDGPACGPGSCRIEAMVTNVGGQIRPGTRHKVVGVIRESQEDKNAPDGEVLGLCEAVLPAMAPDKPGKVGCVVRDPRWVRWALGPGEWYSWSFVTVNPGWEGTDSNVVATLIGKKVEPAMITDIADKSGGLGLTVFARLLQYPGMKPVDAADAVKQAVVSDRLDVLGGYASSGRLGNPGGLSKFVTSMAGKNDTRSLPVTTWDQFAEAAKRAKDGTGPVALGSWTPPGAKAPAGLADVLDTGRKEAVQVSAVTTVDSDDVFAEISKAAQGFGKAPAGYRHLVQIRVADSRNPLHALGKGELRAALKKLGLKPAVLKDVQQLVIVNGAGRHTFAPADFG